MCGIAGFTVAPGDKHLLKTWPMTYSLGIDMMTRGRDATGVATVDWRGNVKVRKTDSKADIFLAKREGIGQSAQSELLHTRAATQGKASLNFNNHPIVHGGIVGIHNGMIWNDNALFQHFEMPRLAEVDSEAIFAAINHLPLDKALTSIDGSWAIAWIDRDNDPRKLWLARGSSSPLCYALTENGSVVFASTSFAVTEAFKWGGVNGKPDVKYAPEGFLAHTDPDNGGLVILDKFDGSGTGAPGARTKVTTHYGGYGGEEWEQHSLPNARTFQPSVTPGYGTTNNSSTPVAYERVQVTGSKWNSKVGDRRKYIDASGHWHTEVCTFVGLAGHASWTRAADEPSTEIAVYDAEVVTPTPPNGGVDSHASPVDSLTDPFEADVETTHSVLISEGVDNDWFEDGWEAPQMGDLIVLDKRALDLGEGHIVGEVLAVDDRPEFKGQELSISWRASRVDITGMYQVLYRAGSHYQPIQQEGVTNVGQPA